jgi:hypothetical protein
MFQTKATALVSLAQYIYIQKKKKIISKRKKTFPFRLLAEKAKSHLPLKQITNF